MNNTFSRPSLIRSGWLRTLLFILAFLILAAAAVIFYFPEQFYTAHAQSLKELLVGERMLVFTLILFVIAVVLTYIFRRWIDRKSIISLGLDISGHVREAIAGLSLAVFMICASTALLKATGHLKWTDILFDPKALFLAFGSVVLISFYEELIFRGYILNNLMDSFPKWLALGISAVLFMLFHWNSTGFFPLVNIMVLGLILGMNYIYTRNLWFSICFHIGWKFMQGPILGFPGDDNNQPLLQTELNGDANVTGAANGLEGSFILLAVALLSLITLYFIFERKLNPRSQPVPGRI